MKDIELAGLIGDDLVSAAVLLLMAVQDNEPEHHRTAMKQRAGGMPNSSVREALGRGGREGGTAGQGREHVTQTA